MNSSDNVHEPDNAAKEYINVLNAPAYSLAQASRLVKMNSWTVRRYLQGYQYDYTHHGVTIRSEQPPVVKDSTPKTIYASFLDLIDLLFVKEFMSRGFGLPTLRRALDEARYYLGTPHFARSLFFTSGKQLILELPDDGRMVALLTGGQGAMPNFISELYDKLEFEDITHFGFAKKWYPRGVDGCIVIDPEISFGRPTLVNWGVSTDNVYDLYLGEKKKIEPVSNWFNIPAQEIQVAVDFEASLWA